MTTIDNMKKSGLVVATLDELLFPVEKIKQMDFACNSDYAYDIFGYLGEDKIKTRLNSCSNRYELVPNGEIFMPVRNTLLEKNISFEESYLHINNSRFYGQFKINEQPFKINDYDEIYPMLKVQHSYNGLTKYMITFGYFRLVCSNGLTIPVKEKEEFNLAITGKHTQSIKHSLERLRDTLDLFINEGKKYLINFSLMADRMVINVEDRIEEVMNFSKINIVNNKNVDTLAFINNIIVNESEKFYDGKVNDWLVYNAINQYINDIDLNVKAPEVRAEMDKKVLQYMIA